MNKISFARLVYVDGAASRSDFPLSNTDTFVPGKTVEILAGPANDPVALFHGIVVKQHIKVRDRSVPQLIVECRHHAVKLAVGRKSTYFFNQTDSDILENLLSNASVQGTIERTSVTHQQQVQYDATDWDFLLTRAEANGKFVFTNDQTVVIQAPTFTGDPVCELNFGSTILEMDASIDARQQYEGVTSMTWDPAQQGVVERDAEEPDPDASGPGNLESSDLAGVVGLGHLRLRHVAVSEEEAQAWADAFWLKSQMSKVSGCAKCEGMGTVNPGDLVTLSGVGDRFNGNAFVTGVRHDFDTVQGWKTHVQFGNTEEWFGNDPTIASPRAGALVPSVNGLQVGVVVSNEDPDGEHRVRVRMPLVNAADDGTWARVAVPDAGDQRGFFFRPEIGDEVILGFLNDDPRQAVVLGMLHSSAKPAPLEATDDNHEKLYQSRSQMKLYFDDDKKVLRLETPAGNHITLNEDEQSLTIADQNGNQILMTPDGIKLESGKAIQLKSQTDVTMESGTALTVKSGTQLKLEGTAGAELSSAAITKVTGSLLQLN